MSDDKRMDAKRWTLFRLIFVAFSVTAAYALFSIGALDDVTSLGGILILIAAFAAVAIGIYRFVKNIKDPDNPLG
ncbi:MAG: hypothetical protein AAGA33_01775 [Pseudomonadota bacterium]